VLRKRAGNTAQALEAEDQPSITALPNTHSTQRAFPLRVRERGRVQTVKADQQLRGGVSKPVELNAPLDGRKPETSRIRNKKEPSFVQDAVKEGGLEPVVRGGRPPRYKMHQDGGANDRCAKAFATALAWVAGQITVNRPLAVTPQSAHQMCVGVRGLRSAATSIRYAALMLPAPRE